LLERLGQLVDLLKEAETNSVTLQEEEPHVVAMALMFIYTSSYIPQDIAEVWPALEEKVDEMYKDDTKFLDSAVKLFMLAKFLLIDPLSREVSDAIFERIDHISSRADDGEYLCSASPEFWSCHMRSKLDALSSILDVLDKIFDQAPDACQLRTRTIIRAFEASEEAEECYASRDNGAPVVVGDWEEQSVYQAYLQAKEAFEEDKKELHARLERLQERLETTIEDQDVVVYNVALHYRNKIQKLKDKLKGGKRLVDPSGGW
jgi:protein-arginine kinase activator protein McsA